MRLFGKERAEPEAPAPVLDLSGPHLRLAIESLTRDSDAAGGVEAYVGALALKTSLFSEVFANGDMARLGESDFFDVCVFITAVRRRIGSWLGANDFSLMRGALEGLLDGWQDPGTVDERLMRFTARFPADKKHRWVRDLAAEILHFMAPETCPLMTRWMWDSGTNSGVVREIWFGLESPGARIEVDDDHATFAALYADLEEFVRDNGIFRDVPLFVDLLCAHIYAAYINDRGGAYLRADFLAPLDPMLHTRRILGLDGIDSESGRTRLKLIDGSAYTVAEPRLLN